MLKILAVVFLSLTLSACGVMLPGTMDGVDNGGKFSFEIERSYGTGKMVAKNLETNEEFTGAYSARYSDGGAVKGVLFTSSGMSSFTSFVPPTHATAEGILRGDQGTQILIYFSITPGIKPTGTGTGVDAEGNKYWIQF